MNRLLTGFILLNLGISMGFVAEPQIRAILVSGGLIGAENGNDPGSSAAEILYWVAPMDANYRRDQPGKSPMGMDLVPVYADEGGSEAGVVKINPSVENNLGVRTSPAKLGALNRDIDTVGYLDFDEEKIFHVHMRVEGWIERLLVKTEGEQVKKGQKLFEIYSPDLVNAQEEYLTALRSNNRVLIGASEKRLGLLGVEAQQIRRLKQTGKIRQRVDFYSEHSGFLNELNIREGMFVKPATEVLSIGQLDSIWVIAEVFERQSGWIRRGQYVEMTVSALPGREWDGRVDYIYPVLDASTRTLRVRLRFDNPDNLLKPNMFAQLKIRAEAEKKTVYIPREALIRSGKMDRVVLALGDGRYKSIVVRSGIESENSVEIIEGLQEGDMIVTSAQFLIDSESSITAEFGRMEPAESVATPNEDPGQVWVEGKVTAVMPGHNMLTVQHQPVESWGWPEMVMDFTVADDIPIAHIKNGEAIRFEVKKLDGGGIRVVAIDDDRIAWVKGRVNQVKTDQQKVNMDHEPVDSWGWPTMTMDFPVSDGVDIGQFEEDRDVQVLVLKSESGSIQIIDVKAEM